MKKSLKVTHGKTETTQPSTLDQVWGDTGLSKYKTLDKDEYVKSLEDMNVSDLQSHARNMGVFPNDNKLSLIKKLTKEFMTHASSYSFPREKKKEQKAPSSAAIKILSEGR